MAERYPAVRQIIACLINFVLIRPVEEKNFCNIGLLDFDKSGSSPVAQGCMGTAARGAEANIHRDEGNR